MSRSNLRLLSALVAGAFTVSGCATTYVVPPKQLSEVAGLPDDRESELETDKGVVTVNGSTRFTLLSPEGTPALWTPSQNTPDGAYHTAVEVRLSSLRSEAGVLVLTETGQSVALDGILFAEFTKPEPGQTVGLLAIILGTALVAFVVAAGVTVSNAPR